MPTLDIFELSTETSIKQTLAAQQRQSARGAQRHDAALAIRYMNGQQLDDVESELSRRYRSRQSMRDGAQIIAQTIPLTQRYVDEAATIYNRPVSRSLVTEDGEETDATRAMTAQLMAMLSDCSYDMTMHAVDKYVSLLKSCAVWYQARGGKLRPQIITPDNLYPVYPDDLSWFDPSDQSDYRAHVVELASGGDINKSFAWSEAGQVGFYSGQTYTMINGGVDFHANPFMWPQVIDTDDRKGSVRTLPLQMLCYFVKDRAQQSILPDSDPSIAMANRELNVQWSVLMDTLRLQGWSQMVLNLINPANPPQNFIAGTRTALPLQLDESASMLASTVNYTDLVGSLSHFVRLMAIAMRQSPNDFSIEGQSAASGFAKLIDSMPKLEARKDRAKLYAQQERDIAWPRLAVIGKQLGYFSQTVEQLSRLRLRTSFAEVEVPLSVDEQVKREAHDITYGITSAAEILADRDGIPIEEAQERVAENLGRSPVGEEQTDMGEETEAVSADATQGQEDVQKTALNGAQVTAMVETVKAAALGEIPRETAISILRVGFRLTQDEASDIVATVGAGFVSSAQQQMEAEQAAKAQQAAAPAAETERPRRGLAGLVGRPGR